MKTRPDLYVRALQEVERFEGARRKYRLDQSVTGTMLVDATELMCVISQSRRERNIIRGWDMKTIWADVVSIFNEVLNSHEEVMPVRVPAALVVALFREQELYEQELYDFYGECPHCKRMLVRSYDLEKMPYKSYLLCTACHTKSVILSLFKTRAKKGEMILGMV